MTTVHSNGARDALSRLETMVLMAGFDLPVRAIREQICSAIDVIMHLDRMPDGRRVVTSLTELQGMEGETILIQDLFHYQHGRRAEDGRMSGELVATGLRPKFLERLAENGIEVPAKAFRPARAEVPVNRSPERGKVPKVTQLIRPERAR